MKFLSSPAQLRKVKLNGSFETTTILKNNEPIAVLMNILEYKSLMSMVREGERARRDPEGYKQEMEAHRAFMRDGVPPDAVDLDDLNPDLTLKNPPKAPVDSTFEPSNPKDKSE